VKLADAVMSGTAMGVSGLFLRLAVMDIPVGMAMFHMLLLDPYAWLSAACGIAAFFYLQRALFSRKISIVVPVVSACSIITPLILSVIFLSEYIPAHRWIGVGMIMVGVIGIAGKEDESAMHKLLRKAVRKMGAGRS
jgi:multidrug transporter EmrE-like cation transporter